MATAPRIDVVEIISNLLAAEQAGLFHFLAESDPWINRAEAELRKPLQEMIDATMRREGELAGLIGELGSTPRPMPVSPEHQYLAFLSIDFLLPKLREAKQLSIRNYEATLQMVGNGNEIVRGILMSHLEELKGEMATLEQAVAGQRVPEAVRG